MNAKETVSKLNRTTLVEQLARGILELIESRKSQPGDKLPSSAEIAAIYGVSRPVVREALKALEAQGVIEIANGRRPTVRPVSAEPLRGFFRHAVQVQRSALGEFMEVRRGLEVQSVQLAAERRTAAQLERLREIVRDLHESSHDPEAFAENDVKFHHAIAQATHNGIMIHLIEAIRDAARATIMEGRRRRMTEAEIERLRCLHDTIVRHIERSDPEAAGRAMSDHFDEIAAFTAPA